VSHREGSNRVYAKYKGSFGGYPLNKREIRAFHLISDEVSPKAVASRPLILNWGLATFPEVLLNRVRFNLKFNRMLIPHEGITNFSFRSTPSPTSDSESSDMPLSIRE